jgi:hypothetical protein
MTRWKLAVLVGAATAIAVTGVAVALGHDSRGDGDRAASAAVVARHDGDRDGGPQGQPNDGQRGALQELMQNPELRDDLLALKDQTENAARAWWDKYGDDPTSAKAREALAKLRDQQRAKFEALLEKYGVSADVLGRMGGGMPGGGMFGTPPGNGTTPEGDATGTGSTPTL